MKFDFGITCVQVYQNYGSAFTNYAMYKVLKDYGKSVLLIEQPRSSYISPDAPRNFAVWPYPEEDCARIYNNKEEMRELNGICESFLVGSDQLFNYEIYRQIDGFVKLEWVDDERDKFSYATSFGINKILGSYEERADLGRRLSRFKSVSVRERAAEKLLKESFGITATAVLDPVFLCKRNHYIKMLTPFKNQASVSSVFCYILDPAEEKEQIIKRVCDITKKNYFIVSDMWRTEENLSDLWSLSSCPKITNEGWLASIYYSDFVITDSFHALCFALIFNKQFIVLSNKLRGDDRFLNLLNILGLTHRLVKNTSDADINALVKESIDYLRINEILKREIIFSEIWLERYILGK